ncbi:MAG: hypothetical protein WD491_01160 [Balneolales bacterium]
MSIRENIINKIKLIDDPVILLDLMQWIDRQIKVIDQRQNENTGGVKEVSESYRKESTRRDRTEKDIPEKESKPVISIQVSEQDDKYLLIDLANRLGLSYQITSVYLEKFNNSATALGWLQKIAEKGGVDGIDDPVEWQKKERRDRSLPLN